MADEIRIRNAAGEWVLVTRTGPQGPVGDKGDRGADSTVPGPTGPTGSAGAPGSQGPTGPAGAASTVPGPQGPQGLTGPQGDIGPAGSQGPQGATGPVGATGPAGLQGTAGQGVPTGGTAGQLLSKIDGTNYNTQWAVPQADVMAAYWRVGYYYSIQRQGVLLTTAGNYSSNMTYFMPLYIPGTHTFDRIAINVTTAGTDATNSSWRLAVFSSDPSNGAPLNVLCDSGVLASTTTGVKEATISPAVISGLVWIATRCYVSGYVTGQSISAAGASFPMAGGASAIPSTAGHAVMLYVVDATGPPINAFSNYTAGSQFASGNVLSLPLVWLRCAS